MSKINFVKMSGAGNDFIIIDNRQNNYLLNKTQIAKISRRQNIGCDQLIIIKNSSKADILMEIYNSDGSKSGSCGNATRCVAVLIMDEKNRAKITVETVAGILKCERQNQNGADLISVNMGAPQFDYQEIPLSKKLDTDSFQINDPGLEAYNFCAVSMGNPHLISFIKNEIADEEFFVIGPQLENHHLFPQKTNVEFARIIGPNHIQVRVWERGAGETLACGTGACAVAVAAIKRKLVNGPQVKISFKGGDLLIEWPSENKSSNQVIMTGGYEKIFSGSIDEKFLA